MSENLILWGPWIKHDGKRMPVPTGTVVEARSDEDPKTARNGVVQRVGIAGVDLVHSWHWTPETRSKQSPLPIDRYRIKRSNGFNILTAVLTEVRELENA